MKLKPIRLAVGAALLALQTTSIAGEFRIDRLLVVGDSLSDGGAYSLTARAGLEGAGVPGALIPDRMRFTTNGPGTQMWADVLAGKLGIPFDVDVINGLPAGAQPNGGNYAQGGSRVSNPAGIGNDPSIGITTIPVTTQVDRLLADNPRLGSRDLVALWAGANDGFTQFGAIAAGAVTIPAALGEMSAAATELLAQIDRLKAAGAENIVVITVPNLGITPQAALIETGAPGSTQVLAALSNAFNTTLVQSAASKGAVVVDSNKLLSFVLADPARYGFSATNPLQPACGTNPGATGPDNFFNSSLTCIQGVNASPDSEQRIFADGVHPTAAAQQLFGEAGFAGLRAAGLNGALAVAPMTPIRQHALTLENRLTALALVEEGNDGQARLRPLGDVQWYGGVEVGRFRSDTQQVQPGLDADTQVLKFGADRMIAQNALLGFGVSIDQAKTKLNDNGGNFKNDVYLGTVFSTVALSKLFYVNAALAAGRIHYDITRQFTLGPSLERYTANTKADFTSARIGLGTIHNLTAGWTINPQLSYTDEKIELNGYNESAGAASLSFGDSTYKAQRISLGVMVTKAPTTPSGWRPVARYSIESDQNDDRLNIRMGPSQDALATISAPRPDGDFQMLSIGAAKKVGAGLVNLHAATTLGQSGVSTLTLGVAYKASF